MSMIPPPAVFNTSNTSGQARISNVLNINPTYQIDSAGESKIYHWLDAPDSSGNYHTAREKHHAQTGVWFIEGEPFVHWKETPDSTLWIYGTPGCGKTIICSTAVEDIFDHCKQNSAYACAYFFLDNRSAHTELSLHHKVLRSIIRQLCAQSTGVPVALVQMYGSGHQQPSTASLKQTLQQIIEGFKRTYIVIDALDECTDREKLLVWIGELVQSKTAKLHLLLSSRKEQDIEDYFNAVLDEVVRVSLMGKSADADIERYLDAMLSKMVGRWDAPTRARVKQVLVPGADGMFRWVALQIAELTKCRSRHAVEKQLRSLPKDLDGVYDRILSNNTNPDDLKQFLTWLAFSACPLDIETLADVITVDFSTNGVPFFNPDLRYFGPKEMLAVCSSLVVEVEGIVKLSHMSVKEYLLSNRIKGRETAYFGIDAMLAQSVIAQTCLAYLVYLGNFAIIDKSTIESFPLAPYAAEYWIFHMRLGCNDRSIAQITARLFSLSNPAALINWVRLHDPDRLGPWKRNPEMNNPDKRDPWDRDLEKPAEDVAAPLYYASIYGLREVAQELLQNGAEVDARGGRYSSALQAASYAGHTAVVGLLLDHGGQVNTQGGDYGNSLQAASHAGNDEIVEMLIEKGAGVNSRGGVDGNAMFSASSRGHSNIVRLLLEKGADVDARSGFKGNAQWAGSRRGYDAVAQLLLKNGADINTRCNGNGLYTASSNGEHTVVQSLLQEGADVNSPCMNAQRGCYGNALQAASYKGHQSVIQLLLENGADPNVAGHFGTSLQAAAYRGHHGIVRLLLENGANVNAQGGNWGSALQAASHTGHQEAVRLLLGNGADLNVQGGPNGSALQAASYRGHYETVRLLLENGADLNVRGVPYGSALQAALHRGEYEIVRLLLENGADANIGLLRKGELDVDAKGESYSKALQAASNRGHEEMVQLLLQSAVDVNVQGGPQAVIMAARNRTARRTRISYDARHPQTRDLTDLITRDTGFSAISHLYTSVYKGNMKYGPATTVVAVTTPKAWAKLDISTRREIAVWKRLHHKNIVEFLGTTFDESPHQSTGMVSPWMVNGNIGTFVTPSLPLAYRLQLTCDVSAGLVYLHSEDIMHGNLTSSNILIDNDGSACLIDFSLSSITSEFEGTEFTPDVIGGALRFRALEISPPVYGDYENHNPELTFACDVYSLGSVILQVLSSLQPYYNIPSDIMIALALARKTKPERPVSTPLTDTYWKFIQGCWCDTPENRPSAANAHEQLLCLRE